MRKYFRIKIHKLHTPCRGTLERKLGLDIENRSITWGGGFTHLQSHALSIHYEKKNMTEDYNVGMLLIPRDHGSVAQLLGLQELLYKSL